ncbi:amidohydrolase family protein [Gammaproteobacteria bacterium]|nr:amidohydrolase family protein [Gammaproteobacteria bacterium]
MKPIFNVLLVIFFVFISPLTYAGSDQKSDSQIYIKNVTIFDGKNENLKPNMNILVEGQLIKIISNAPIKANKNAVVIYGNNNILMPGMIDGHAHIMINADYGDIEKNMDLADLAIRATVVVERFLMDGFTSVRDMGGPVFALQRNIDSGLIIGPRIFPSGSFISQTSGHGDFRDRADPGFTNKISGDKSNFERFGLGNVADGVPQVLAATRLNLRNGASQIKIMAGGGGSSRFDPIDTTQYSKEEVCAIVEATKDWGTYVAAHVYTDRSVKRLLDCGVKSFEHGFFISEGTMKRIAKEGGFVVPQMWGISPELAKNPLMPKAKIPEVTALGKKYKNFGRNLVKHKVKVVFASDYVGPFSDAERARRYELWWRTQTFDSNFEVLKQLTSVAGEMLELSGSRNPYKAGKLGVIAEGAYADILIVKGNPLKDISVLGGTKQWFEAPITWKPIETIQLVMKGGKIYKNSLLKDS